MVEGSTYRDCWDSIHFELLDPTRLKGFADPQAVFRPVAMGSGSGRGGGRRRRGGKGRRGKGKGGKGKGKGGGKGGGGDKAGEPQNKKTKFDDADGA